ncbi:MAG: PRC-barrel domain-containing protein [Candidatus Hydrothermarchaeaceae archaeon]
MVSRLNEIVGLDVFTEDGKRIGTFQDVSIDPETGKVLGVVLNDINGEFAKSAGIENVGKGVVVPYAAVKSVGDIILLKNVVYTSRQTE